MRSETFDDGGEVVEALIVEVGDDAELPDDPWGARWIEAGTLAVLAEGWDQPAGVVAHRIESLQSEIQVVAQRMESLQNDVNTGDEIEGGPDIEVGGAGEAAAVPTPEDPTTP